MSGIPAASPGQGRCCVIRARQTLLNDALIYAWAIMADTESVLDNNHHME